MAVEVVWQGVTRSRRFGFKKIRCFRWALWVKESICVEECGEGRSSWLRRKRKKRRCRQNNSKKLAKVDLWHSEAAQQVESEEQTLFMPSIASLEQKRLNNYSNAEFSIRLQHKFRNPNRLSDSIFNLSREILRAMKSLKQTGWRFCFCDRSREHFPLGNLWGNFKISFL